MLLAVGCMYRGVVKELYYIDKLQINLLPTTGIAPITQIIIVDLLRLTQPTPL